ncbi:methyl-accepting chemotaxis protein [Candidatus Moduliflexus flocculans]|uniref:Methyl-accepting chemotaxis protein n=1 Tax=Candidatus Moduliflexus flocculans TaxID=1499966 RepID=A0A081BSJ1_9BACT|nr:methyl-accepting chemotaxis protein [Candidatus Moduliflexus flocculans]
MKIRQQQRVFKQRKLSIQLKIGMTIILLTTAILSGFGLYQYQTRQTRELDRLNAFSQNAAQQLALNLVSPLWDFDKEQMVKVVETAMQDGNILAIAVKDKSQSLLVARGRDQDWNLIETLEKLTETGTPTTVDITKDNNVIGSIEVYVTQRLVQQELKLALREIAIIVIVLDALLFIMLILSIRILLIHPLTSLLKIARLMAEGDFRQAVNIRQHDEIGELAGAFQEMKDTLAKVFNQVQKASSEATLGSQQLRDSAMTMSQRGTQQAASTEEISSSMEEMMANISQNADNAKQTELIALQAAKDAQEGGQAVVEAVGAIKKIAQTITIIEEIASRTHILSMNASIEASKAQEFGKGFGVVAAEVRNLAAQSQGAAKEINTLAHSTVELAEVAGQKLHRLVPDIQHTAELIQEISAASQEQRAGAMQITQAMQQLDTVTQGYAATAEEVASTAEELASQSEQLERTIAFFKLPEITSPQPAAPEKWQALFQVIQTLPDKDAQEQLLLAIGNVLKESKDRPAASKFSPHHIEKKSALNRQENTQIEQHHLDSFGETSYPDELDNEFEHY